MKLSILICSLESRAELLRELMDFLQAQIGERPVEIIPMRDRGEITTGAKRNLLLEKATGEYVCFVDDDDWVSPDYVDILLEGIKINPDCIGLIGEITTDNQNPKKFIHSLKYRSWFEKDNIYYRCVNHLNCIKKVIALQIGYPDKYHGEDHDYSIRLSSSGLLKTEAEINETIYYYRYKTQK